MAVIEAYDPLMEAVANKPRKGPFRLAFRLKLLVPTAENINIHNRTSG